MNTGTKLEPPESNLYYDPFIAPQLFPVNWDLSEMVNPSSTPQLVGGLPLDKIVFEQSEFSQGE
jgi:hypothetical protein